MPHRDEVITSSILGTVLTEPSALGRLCKQMDRLLVNESFEGADKICNRMGGLIGSRSEPIRAAQSAATGCVSTPQRDEKG